MYFNPPTPGNNPANPFYHRTHEEQRRAIEEAVTVELDFKKDADGKKAGGKMVRKGVYKMTFKNNAEMNKFMDTHADKLNEEKEMDPAKHVSRSKKNPDMFCVFDKDGEEVKLFKEKSDAIEYAKKNHDALMESTPEYRAMIKRYKGSDMEKVFKILDKEGFRMGEQSDTLVRNMLKKHRGNVKKAADQIMKDNPGMFDVNRMMMDDVQIDEKIMIFTFRKNEDAKEFQDKAFMSDLADATDIMTMPGGKTGVEVSSSGPKGDKGLIPLAKKMGGRLHKIVEEDVQLDEMSAKQHYNKMVAQGKGGRGGRVVTPIDKKRFPNREREGLEGPFRNRKSGLVYYYDKKAGKYYDPLSDMFLQVSDVMENTATYNLDEYLAEEND